jgi:hypothetical protein
MRDYLNKLKGSRLVAICDVDSDVLAKRAAECEKAGVKVDAATLEQAAKDQAARDAARGPQKAVPMQPMAPAGGMVPATPMKPVTPGDGSKKQ